MKFKVAFTLVALTPPLSAVSAHAHIPEAPSNWTLSIGADPSHFDLRTRDPGVKARFVGTLARSWATRFERLRLKAEVMAGMEAPHGFRDTDGSLCGGCDIDVRRRFSYAGVGVTLQLLRTSRFKTFLTSGTGIYANHSDARSYRNCTNFYCIAGGKPYYARHSDDTSLGFNGGIGMSFRMRGREFFVQRSGHVFDFRRGQAIFAPSFGIGF